MQAIAVNGISDFDGQYNAYGKGDDTFLGWAAYMRNVDIGDAYPEYRVHLGERLDWGAALKTLNPKTLNPIWATWTLRVSYIRLKP